MRFSLLLLVGVLHSSVAIGWTGIGAFIGQQQSDWQFSASRQTADIGFYGLGIEDRTQSPLRVGASAGQFDLRLLPSLSAPAERYNGKFLSFYLRLPVALGDGVMLHSKLSYRYNLGNKSLQQSQQISWSAIDLELGLSLRLGNVLLRPFGYFRRIDGDITDPALTRLFEQAQSAGYGAMLDYYTERSAYIRLRGSAGSRQAVSISFVREY